VKNLIRQILRETPQGFKQFDKVIDIYMRKKYPWWINLDTSGFSYGSNNPKYITWHGVLTVDETWYNSLCEKSRFSDCETETGVRIDLLLNDYDEIYEIAKRLETMYLHMYGENKTIGIKSSLKLLPKKELEIVKESNNNRDNKIVEKIREAIEKYGLFKAMKMLNMNYTKLFSMAVVPEHLTRKIKQDFIQDYMSTLDFGFGLTELGIENIPYGGNETEIFEIAYLGLSSVTIDVTNKITFQFAGDFRRAYNGLNDDIIDQIFDVVVELYDNDVNF
jgi:hypothetical protein